MLSEAFAQHGEWLEQVAIECDQCEEDIHGYHRSVLDKGLDLLFQILLKLELVVIN